MGMSIDRLTQIGRILVEDLNEMASLHWQGKPLANHTPSRPRYWFAGLVRETGWTVDTIPESVRSNLTPGAIRLWRAIAPGGVVA